jgi:hypothetical protein
MKPDAARATKTIFSCGIIIQNEDRRYQSLRGGFGEGRVVSKPQIMPKPMECAWSHSKIPEKNNNN